MQDENPLESPRSVSGRRTWRATVNVSDSQSLERALARQDSRDNLKNVTGGQGAHYDLANHSSASPGSVRSSPPIRPERPPRASPGALPKNLSTPTTNNNDNNNDQQSSRSSVRPLPTPPPGTRRTPVLTPAPAPGTAPGNGLTSQKRPGTFTTSSTTNNMNTNTTSNNNSLSSGNNKTNNAVTSALPPVPPKPKHLAPATASLSAPSSPLTPPASSGTPSTTDSGEQKLLRKSVSDAHVPRTLPQRSSSGPSPSAMPNTLVPGLAPPVAPRHSAPTRTTASPQSFSPSAMMGSSPTPSPSPSHNGNTSATVSSPEATAGGVNFPNIKTGSGSHSLRIRPSPPSAGSSSPLTTRSTRSTLPVVLPASGSGGGTGVGTSPLPPVSGIGSPSASPASLTITPRPLGGGGGSYRGPTMVAMPGMATGPPPAINVITSSSAPPSSAKKETKKSDKKQKEESRRREKEAKKTSSVDFESASVIVGSTLRRRSSPSEAEALASFDAEKAQKAGKISKRLTQLVGRNTVRGTVVGDSVMIVPPGPGGAGGFPATQAAKPDTLDEPDAVQDEEVGALWEPTFTSENLYFWVRSGNINELRKALGTTPPSYSLATVTDPKGSEESLLHAAVTDPNPFTDVVKLLLRYRADPNVVNKDDLTPLHTVVARSAQPAIVKLLLEAGASVDGADVNQNSILHSFALQTPTSESQIKALEKTLNMLLAKGADINAINSTGQTPLMLACGNTLLFTLLVRKNPNLNVVANSGDTVLHTVVRARNQPLVSLLLSQKSIDPRMGTPPVSDIDSTPLILSLLFDKLQEFEGQQQKLQRQLSAINFREALATAPMAGAVIGDAASKKSDRNKKELRTFSSLAEVMQNADTAELKRFLKLNPTVSAKLSTEILNEEGQMALHVVCARDEETADPQVVKFMLKQKGVTPNIRDTRGWTPLHCCAFTNGNPRIVSILSISLFLS
eukprot:TRINITY_DN3530_c0_g2_i1.p1 TRINITY_DN3530_c0_g2~~TRINITY_DN3530_c0_g2_i1.p1  ORF type:complete len:961 (-),score=151.76 TRINITY_DN3530_c0_g2_i1:769-3651(-)